MTKKKSIRLLVILSFAIMLICAGFSGKIAYAKSSTKQTIRVTYSVHQQSYGTCSPVENGKVAGVTGQGKRLEALTINFTVNGVVKRDAIKYKVHCQSLGWSGWQSSGTQVGTAGAGKRLEAVKIKLSKTYAKTHDVYYRTYMSNSGWLGWTKNGTLSGTVNCSATIEAIQILVCKKGVKGAPKLGKYPYINGAEVNSIYYRGHVQSYGDMLAVCNGQTLGYAGLGKRLENVTLALTHGAGQFKGGVTYRAHCQNVGWTNAVTDNKECGTRGCGLRMEAISIALYGDISRYMDVYYRVYIETFGWIGWTKNGNNAGSMGYGKRIEAIQIKLVAKGAEGPKDPETRTVSFFSKKPSADLDVPLFIQGPELPSGCESCAMTMALNYYGFGLKKTDFADKWLIKNKDFMIGFNGSPYVEFGGCIYAPGLTNCANNFLISRGSARRAHNITGASLETLKMYVANGYPVVVYFTSDYGPSLFDGSSSVYNGKRYLMSVNLHCIVLSGFNDANGTVKLTDSIWGIRRIPQADFDKTFDTMYRQAIVIY